jgi:hypothetical protein
MRHRAVAIVDTARTENAPQTHGFPRRGAGMHLAPQRGRGIEIVKSKALRGYVLLVGLAALASYAAAPGGTFGDPATVLLLLGLTALAGARPVRIPSLRVEFVGTHPFVLCTLAVLGARPAMLAALAGVLGAALVRERQAHPLRMSFNLAAVPLSTAAAAQVFVAFGGSTATTLPNMLAPLAAATTSYFVANSALVSIAVTMERGLSFGEVWRESFLWTVTSYLTGFSVAVALLLVFRTIGPWALVLGVPPAWLFAGFYRAQRDKLLEKQRRLEEVQGLNTELARTVGELRDALDHVKQLQGLLPICMHCSNIRDEKNVWHRLEAYIEHHSDARFTHSLCSPCRRKHYPGINVIELPAKASGS